MQTIKVEANATTYGVAFSIKDGNFLASVNKDTHNQGKWEGRFSPYAIANNLRSFADAVEYVSDAITSHFAAYGLNVEFIR